MHMKLQPWWPRQQSQSPPKSQRPWRLSRSPVIIATVADCNRLMLATTLEPHLTRVDASLGVLRERTPCDEYHPCWTARNHIFTNDAYPLSIEYREGLYQRVCCLHDSFTL